MGFAVQDALAVHQLSVCHVLGMFWGHSSNGITGTDGDKGPRIEQGGMVKVGKSALENQTRFLVREGEGRL